MVTINWTEQAVADLIGIAEFIRRDSPRFARLTVQSIRELTKQLKHFPQSGRIVPEIGQSEVRELIYVNYRIIYRIVSDERIDILTIHHSAKKM